MIISSTNYKILHYFNLIRFFSCYIIKLRDIAQITRRLFSEDLAYFKITFVNKRFEILLQVYKLHVHIFTLINLNVFSEKNLEKISHFMYLTMRFLGYVQKSAKLMKKTVFSRFWQSFKAKYGLLQWDLIMRIEKRKNMFTYPLVFEVMCESMGNTAKNGLLTSHFFRREIFS